LGHIRNSMQEPIEGSTCQHICSLLVVLC
jgi:hypothetical protein